MQPPLFRAIEFIRYQGPSRESYSAILFWSADELVTEIGDVTMAWRNILLLWVMDHGFEKQDPDINRNRDGYVTTRQLWISPSPIPLDRRGKGLGDGS